jgi:hemoglobin-like flavoprotein
MNSIKKRYWILSILGAVLIGILVFFMSYRSAKDILIKQTYHTTQVVTDVKWTLLERKLYSLEQQLNLLSRNKVINTLFTAPIENHTAQKADPQFDTYVESLLNNQGCHDLLLVRSSGEVVYTHNPTLDRTALPAEIYRIAQQGIEMQDSTTLKIILNETAPHQFYVSKSITDAKGVVLGALLLEIPKEFLSIELRNTINSDSLTSYLVSKLGIMDQHGKINPEKCISCRWNDDAFIQFSPPKKIGGTWTLLSVYPISEIKTQHSMYLASLDGMIAFFAAAILVMTILYIIQLIQRAKGITNTDILLVQATWNAVSEYSTKIIAGFYKHLFADAPEVRPMFKSEQSVQEKRMALMINTIVNSADSLEEFKVSISQLAKRHVHMGVKNEYFPIVVKAIISSVEEQYGKGFTSAHKKAWYKILNQISTIMMEEMESYQRNSHASKT